MTHFENAVETPSRCMNCKSSEVVKLANGLFYCRACGGYVPSTLAAPSVAFASAAKRGTVESLLDSRVERTARFAASSDTHLKYACIVAASVVGTYSGVTQEIAKRTKRSVSSVENWAHAFWLYVELRKAQTRHFDFQCIRVLWRVLPASTWWLAYDIQRAGYNALSYLNMAAAHKWSGRAMMGEFDKDLHAGLAPLIFSRAVLSFRGLADELAKSRQLTEQQAQAVEMVQEAFA